MMIDLAKKAQISLMLLEKNIILVKYLDFANVFFKIVSKVFLKSI